MSSNKEHAPTATRLRKLREEGQLPSLAPMLRALSFATIAVAIVAGGQHLFGLLCELSALLLSLQAPAGLARLCLLLCGALAFLLAALVLPANLLALTLTSFHFRLLNVAPRIDRLRPFQSWKQRWSRWTLLSGLFGGAPALVAIAVMVRGFKAGTHSAFTLCAAGLKAAALSSLGLALAQYLLQQVAFRARNRMSTTDLKEEHKNAEGSPETRARLARERERSARQPPVRVAREASFVVRNPTRLCCAVSRDAFPRVLAAGRGERAKRLVREARRSAVPEIVDRPLALALLDADEGAPVPEELVVLVQRLQRWAENERQLRQAQSR